MQEDPPKEPGTARDEHQPDIAEGQGSGLGALSEGATEGEDEDVGALVSKLVHQVMASVVAKAERSKNLSRSGASTGIDDEGRFEPSPFVPPFYFLGLCSSLPLAIAPLPRHF